MIMTDEWIRTGGWFKVLYWHMPEETGKQRKPWSGELVTQVRFKPCACEIQM
jgi:hypothetical protein